MASRCMWAVLVIALGCEASRDDGAVARDAGGTDRGPDPGVDAVGVPRDVRVEAGGGDGASCPARSRCGERCCAAEEYCYLGACVVPGMPCARRDACGASGYCEPSLGRCLPSAGRTRCEYRPMGSFRPEVALRWPRADTPMPEWSRIIATPLVVPLAARGPDGTEALPPAIVFTAGTDIVTAHLRAIDGRDGRDLFHNTTDALPGQSQIAAGDLDADGALEIVGMGEGTRSNCGFAGRLDGGALLIFDAAGRVRARSTERLEYGAAAPSLADLDGDGRAEIVVGATVFRGDGTRLWVGTGGIGKDGCSQAGAMSIVADVTGDGRPEVVAGNTAYDAAGRVQWTARTREGAAVPDGFAATADFERDGRVEVVLVHGGDRGVSVLDGATGLERCRTASAGSGNLGGGPPVVADFDGDARPEVGVVTRNRYTVFEGDCRVLWSVAVRDDSGQTASSVFDFDGDGRAEVVYTDETQVQVFDGQTGRVRVALSHRSATGLENPVVADVDADGHAEIVAVGQGTPALQVFRDAERNWVASRALWNQHAYHVTNVLDTGAIPRMEAANWTVPYLNNYRANVQGEGVFDVPNLVLTDLGLDLSRCPAEIGLRVRVVNRGARGVPAGVRVRFDLRGDGFAMPATVELRTTRVLLPGDSELVLARVMPSGAAERFELRAVVDPGEPFGEVRECTEDDNGAGPVVGSCTGPM